MDKSQWFQAERRKFPRTKVAVQVELRPEGSPAPIRVETTDICAIGCYVEMSMTLEVGTKLAVVLWLGGEKVLAAGKVITRHPQFGNGIELVGMSPDNREKLTAYLQSIAG